MSEQTKKDKKRWLGIKRKKLGLTSWIIIGLVLGVITGLLFGEDCSDLKLIGVIFIQLLQMTILPYIVVSLIHGIGGLSASKAKSLALRGGMLLFVFWGAILFIVFLMPIAFPEVQSASFFSTSMVERPPEQNLLDLYIPSNPFSSLANAMIPAVVLFGICLGIALIGIDGKKKKPLLDVLEVARDALTKVAKGVVYLTPIGVFAFAANAAGTLTIDQIGRLQVFFITFILMSLLLTFLVFPLIVTTCTPFKYKQVVGISRDALVTSFTTGNLFIVLPMIADRVKGLLASREDGESENQELPDVIIPVTFNFPDAGQLGSVLFILFASWFAGGGIALMEYPALALSGLLSFFGGSNLAIPYLLEQYRLSMDYFQLYIIAGIINGYFATMAAAMHLITFTIVCAYSMSHGIKISLSRIIVNAITIVAVLIVSITGTKIYLKMTVKSDSSQQFILDNMSLKTKVKATVLKKYPERSHLDKWLTHKNAPNRLKRIKESGEIKVGYNPNTMPFCFFNAKHELVGYDIQMAHLLAKDLKCSVKFIPIKFTDLGNALNNGVVDIAMMGIYVNLDRISKMDFTDSYMDIHPALIVKDYRKKEFEDQSEIPKMKNLTLAILKGSAFIPGVKKACPNARLVEIDDYSEFFSGKIKADALVHSAEQGATWVLKYPAYCVVLLNRAKQNTIVAYAIAKGDLAFLEYLNYWLKMKKMNNVTDENYKYWVLGVVPELKKPRWCILRNVLHWID